MKPGEFMGAEGLTYGVIQAIRIFDVGHGGHSAGVVCIDHPDFASAVAALQSLIRPSLDPRSGRVLAMGEVLDEDYIDGLRRCGYVSDQPWTHQS
jgi:hypothetical protein